jgi:DnaK suppressor protein
MAKATKAPEKKTTKAATKSQPARTAKPEAKPAAAKAARSASEPPARPAVDNGKAKAARGEAKPEPKIDPSQLRAHPDAKLSQKELGQLFAKLREERARVIGGFEKHVQEALSDDDVLADEIDIAQRSTDQAWLFRFADKERKLLIEIDAAVEKMKNGEYGICEGTDEPIGFKRLELRPWTRYSVAYKELLEREKAQQAR